VLTDWREELKRSHRHADSGWMFPSTVGKPHHNTSCMGKAFADCLKEIKVDRRFSSHGLRRTANDLIRRVASGEVARAITGHVTQRMTEHYSHIDVGEEGGGLKRHEGAAAGRLKACPQLGTFLGTCPPKQAHRGRHGGGDQTNALDFRGVTLWALQGLNLRLPPCEGGTLPLS
jgi:Phage integrase family